MRLSKAERAAAAAVLSATVAVVVSGVKLLKRHSRYMAQKAAAFFKDSEVEDSEFKDSEPQASVDGQD